LAAQHALRLLHKYKGKDMAQLLDLFDRDILDDEGEPHLLRKTDSDFFERIVGILPIHIKHLSREQLVRSLEVIVKRGLGSDRLFRDYLLLKLERNVMKLSVDQYCRMLRALADKQYVEDLVFWNEYVFKFITDLPQPGNKKPKGPVRTFTDPEARKLWDSLIYLKLKCPSLDLKDYIGYIEKFMVQEIPAAQV
jgi:hypothetical protein